jgi:hypothetical protein
MLLSPVRTKMVTIMPSITMIPIACCQESPRPKTIVNTTTAFIPIPEARANGVLVIRPMSILISPAPIHVAITAASNGIPVAPPADSMAGFTKMM